MNTLIFYPRYLYNYSYYYNNILEIFMGSLKYKKMIIQLILNINLFIMISRKLDLHNWIKFKINIKLFQKIKKLISNLNNLIEI